MKKLLVSINSINENTGGGLYLRSLINELSQDNIKLDVICKSSYNDSKKFDNNIIYLKKNFLSDLLSRCLLIPCFLGFYTFKIMSVVKNNNFCSIHFHSSRTIPIALLIRFLYKKPVYVHFDNIEYKLSIKIAKSIKEVPFRILDSIYLLLYEKVLSHYLTGVTFITKNDKDIINPHIINSIIPIKIPTSKSIIPNDLISSRCNSKKKRILFVASFEHAPNVVAAKKVINIAQSFEHCEFLIVGRNAKRLNLFSEKSKNISIHSDVQYSELQKIYLNSHIVLCPVDDGGGMKTKIAEAMSFKLPVVCTTHSAIGYDSVIGQTNLIKVVNLSNFYDGITTLLEMYDHKEILECETEKYYNLFIKNYSY
ncbi:glycosyltransferase [Providencia stuartii]|uniref:glycosyltransferase n=1 Tax=Providencia stuartii TaxID=588 RepID=UPI0004F76DDD|nr:glycosyltransferase [Providencia stuartii]AIN65342.1 glycosyl transferases group 1 family protein [Providencia stuartii]MBK1419162.1 glycosyltransferase [Providencia stuartii]QQC53229.1 glycosyltransferase [Providencia stuartii]